MQRIPTHISGDGTAVPLVPPPPRNIRRRAGQCPLSGVKRTCLFAPHMSAFDPKRTFQHGTAAKWPKRKTPTVDVPMSRKDAVNETDVFFRDRFELAKIYRIPLARY